MKLTKFKNRTVAHETRKDAQVQEHHFMAQNLKESIEKKAYELYEQRGCQPGYDWEDWFWAETLICSQHETEK